jgi:hypothetical protein
MFSLKFGLFVLLVLLVLAFLLGGFEAPQGSPRNLLLQNQKNKKYRGSRVLEDDVELGK